MVLAAKDDDMLLNIRSQHLSQFRLPSPTKQSGVYGDLRLNCSVVKKIGSSNDVLERSKDYPDVSTIVPVFPLDSMSAELDMKMTGLCKDLWEEILETDGVPGVSAAWRSSIWHGHSISTC